MYLDFLVAIPHPLFTKDMHVYSDTRVSDFLCGMTGEESVGFLNDWTEQHDHREKIYTKGISGFDTVPPYREDNHKAACKSPYGN